MPSPAGIKLTKAHRKTLAVAIDNQSAVAARVGVAPQMISQILSGKKRPSLDTLRAVCRAVGLRCRVKTTVDIFRGA